MQVLLCIMSMTQSELIEIILYKVYRLSPLQIPDTLVLLIIVLYLLMSIDKTILQPNEGKKYWLTQI